MYFSKVSKEQWLKDGGNAEDYNDIKLPRQATSYSMGMDFFAPYDIIIPSGEATTIPTGIRWITTRCEAQRFGLMVVPRSGLGYRYGLRIASTIGCIDADYARAENEGHIMCKLYNPSTHDVVIKKGNGFAQGIVIPYFICEGAESNKVRVGGFGSTTK